MRHLALLAAGAFAAVAAPAAAQSTDGGTRPDPSAVTGGDRITVAVGAANVPDYEGARNNEWIPGAQVVGTVSGIDFFTRGTQLYVDLVKDRPGVGTNLELGVIGAVRLNRTGDIQNAQVDALGSPGTAYEVGGFVGVSRTGVITSDFDVLTARIGVVADVSDTYDSYVVTPQVNYTTPLSYTTLVSFGASADYVGRGYGRTYYNVTPVGALASGLRPYAVDGAGWSRFNLSAFGVQSLSGDLRRGFGIGAGVLYGKLLGDYKRSPIVRDVGDADQWAFAAGLTYTF